MDSMADTRPPARAALRFAWGTFVALLTRPSLWLVAVRQLARMTPPRWWARAPYLPVPDMDYVRFRLETQYGRGRDSGAVMNPDDVVVYLRWCRTFGR